MLALSGTPILVQGLQHDFPEHDGLEVWEALNVRFDAPVDQSEISNLQRKWLDLNIPTRIGCVEHTVQRLAQRMSVLNTQLPKGDRYGEDMSAKKLLTSVKKASQYLFSLANAELSNTPEHGRCWRAGSREQPAQRDMLLTTRYLHQLWYEGVRDNYISRTATLPTALSSLLSSTAPGPPTRRSCATGARALATRRGSARHWTSRARSTTASRCSKPRKRSTKANWLATLRMARAALSARGLATSVACATAGTAAPSGAPAADNFRRSCLRFRRRL